MRQPLVSISKGFKNLFFSPGQQIETKGNNRGYFGYKNDGYFLNMSQNLAFRLAQYIVKLISLMVMVTLQSSCGGGGGGGGGSNTDDNDDSSPFHLSIHRDNVQAVSIVGLGMPEGILQISQAAATGVFDLTRSLVASPLETMCGVTGNGQRIVSHSDIDLDGAVSAGDSIVIQFSDCYENSINDTANGTIHLNLTQFSLSETGELAVEGVLSFNQFFIEASGQTVLVNGEFNIDYELNLVSEVLSASASDTQVFKVTVAGLSEQVMGFSITKNNVFTAGQYYIDISAVFVSDILGFDMRCDTTALLSGSHLPETGELICLAEDGSSAKLSPAENGIGVLVRIDEDGNGTSDLEVPGAWLSYAEGFIFSRETHFLRNSGPDTIPMLQADTMVLGQSVYAGSPAFDSVNDLLYITDYPNLLIVDPISRSVIDKHPVNHASSGCGGIVLSADGSMLYCRTSSSTEIKQYSIPDGVFQGYITTGTGGGTTDLSVSPSDPQTVAVSVTGEDQVIVFHNRSALPNTLSGEGLDVKTIAFNETGDKIYAYTADKTVVELSVLEDGVDVNEVLINIDGLIDAPYYPSHSGPFNANKMTVKDGHIRFGGGWRIDIDAKRVVGQFSTAHQLNPDYDGVIVDNERNRAYAFFNRGTFFVFDLDTMNQRSRYQVDTGGSSLLGPVVDMEEIGIVFVTSGTNGDSLNFLNKSDFKDPVAPPCSFYNLNNIIIGQHLKHVRCNFKDAIYDPVNHKIYATIPGSAGAQGNSLMVVDPNTGNIDQRLWLGSSPGKLALSSDASRLYVALENEFSILMLDPTTFEVNDRVFIGQNKSGKLVATTGMAVSPINPMSFVVSGEELVAAFVNGSRSPNANGQFSQGFEHLHYSSDGSTLYGIRTLSLLLEVFSIDASGVQLVTQFSPQLEFSGADMQGDYLLGGDGSVIHLPTLAKEGTLDKLTYHYDAVMADINHGRFYTYDHFMMDEYDSSTLTSIRTMDALQFFENEDENNLIKMFNIGEDRLGLLWDRHLDIYDKGDFK